MKKSVLGWLLLTLFISSAAALSIVSANTIDYDIFALSSTTITLSQTVTIYCDVGYVESNGVPPANFVWYVNGSFTKSETAAGSNLTFSSPKLGTYEVTATVNGYSNGEVVTVKVLSNLPSSDNKIETPTTATPTSTQTIISTLPPLITPTVPEYSTLVIVTLLFSLFPGCCIT
jgi:hypothetical protein